MNTEVNVAALVKGVERYIILFDDEHRIDAYRQLGLWASNKQLSLTWWDAARMSKSMRDSEAQQTHRPRRPR